MNLMDYLNNIYMSNMGIRPGLQNRFDAWGPYRQAKFLQGQTPNSPFAGMGGGVQNFGRNQLNSQLTGAGNGFDVRQWNMNNPRTGGWGNDMRTAPTFGTQPAINTMRNALGTYSGPLGGANVTGQTGWGNDMRTAPSGGMFGNTNTSNVQGLNSYLSNWRGGGM